MEIAGLINEDQGENMEDYVKQHGKDKAEEQFAVKILNRKEAADLMRKSPNADLQTGDDEFVVDDPSLLKRNELFYIGNAPHETENIKALEKAGLNEAIAQPNTIQVLNMTNQQTHMDFPNPEPLDDQMYADAVEMAEDKYAMGTKIEFIYMDAAGKSHEGELELRGVSDYEGPYFEDGKSDSARDRAVIDLFDEFS